MHRAEPALRVFEKRLLASLGYGLEFPVEARTFYRYRVGEGLAEVREDSPGAYSGRCLLALQEENLRDAESLDVARRAVAPGAGSLSGRPRAAHAHRGAFDGAARKSMSSQTPSTIALGINIDHVATVRQARRAPYPDPVHAALLAEQAGADNITLHLREDRRHIQDRDVHALRPLLQTRMNLEMGLTSEMLEIAVGVRPQDCCLVPENRAEITTEGGLDVAADVERVAAGVRKLVRRRASAWRCSSRRTWRRSRRPSAPARRSSSCTPAPMPRRRVRRRRANSNAWPPRRSAPRISDSKCTPGTASPTTM